MKSLSATEAREIREQLAAAHVVGDVQLARKWERALRGTDQASVREAKQLCLYMDAHNAFETA